MDKSVRGKPPDFTKESRLLAIETTVSGSSLYTLITILLLKISCSRPSIILVVSTASLELCAAYTVVDTGVSDKTPFADETPKMLVFVETIEFFSVVVLPDVFTNDKPPSTDKTSDSLK